jgi:hypothetical protein
MTRWEYKSLEITGKMFWGLPPSAETVQTQLNKLGAEGWELVAMFQAKWSVIATLKRSR